MSNKLGNRQRLMPLSAVPPWLRTMSVFALATTLAGCVAEQPPPPYAYYPVPCPPAAAGAPPAAPNDQAAQSPPTEPAPAQPGQPSTGCYVAAPAAYPAYAYPAYAYPYPYYPGYVGGVVIGGHGHWR